MCTTGMHRHLLVDMCIATYYKFALFYDKKKISISMEFQRGGIFLYKMKFKRTLVISVIPTE